MQMGRQNRYSKKDSFTETEPEREGGGGGGGTGKKNKNNNNNNKKKEKKKKKLGNRRGIDVHCWQGFSAVLRPVKTGGSAPFRFKCSSSSLSSFVMTWRISTRRNLNCQNSSKSLNHVSLCKEFVLSRKIKFLRSSRLWR